MNFFEELQVHIYEQSLPCLFILEEFFLLLKVEMLF
jgi:hypothetical protein